MQFKTVMVFIVVSYVFSASAVFAQAFGEYGRAVGNVPRGKNVTGPKGSGGVTTINPGRGGTTGGAVPEGRVLPTRLVVAVSEAGLYPRQDDEAQKLGRLNQGEVLTPMLRSSGGIEWYMVRTQKGAVGWVKSTDVTEDLKK
jgi:hypothetical protein